MIAPMPARTRRPPQPDPTDEFDEFDDLTDEQIEQAQAGSLIRFQGASFEKVSWSIRRYRTRQEQASDPSAAKLEWVADHIGPLNGKDLVEIIGGGSFNALGYVPRGDGRGVRIAFNEDFSLAGPRKDFTRAHEPAALSAAEVERLAAGPVMNGHHGPSEATQLILRAMEKSEERFERLLTTLVSAQQQRAPAEKPTSITDIVAAVAAMKELAKSDAPTGDSPLEVAKMVMNGFHQGVTLGQEREPIPAGATEDPNPMGPVVLKGLEILQDMLRRAPMGGRPAARPPGAPPPHPPSSATVVDNGTGPAATSAPAEPVAAPPDTSSDGPAPAEATDDPYRRWKTAIEAIYRGMVTGRDPAALADSLPDILNETELSIVRGTPGNEPDAEQALAFLAPLVEGYPALREPQGKVYLDSILHALRAEDDVDDDDDGIIDLDPSAAPAAS